MVLQAVKEGDTAAPFGVSVIPAEVDAAGRCNPVNAARVLQVSVHTLANWRSSGLGGPPFLKRGRKVFYLYDDLVKFARGEAA